MEYLPSLYLELMLQNMNETALADLKAYKGMPSYNEENVEFFERARRARRAPLKENIWNDIARLQKETLNITMFLWI